MKIEEFNQASSEELTTLLKHCVHIQRWSDEILSQRPFGSTQALMDFAKAQASTWTWLEIANALATHPRIGEKKAQAVLSEKEQAFSNQEQSAIKQSTETQHALLQGNITYEKKFGHIFLIRAMGLDQTEILQALKYRLLNDPETEQRIVKQQLGEIAMLRLSQELSEDESLND